MDLLLEFDKIRPYNDSEVAEAIDRIINEEHFKSILSYLYRNKNIDEVIKMFKKIKTVSDFQSVFSHYAVREIIRQTSDGLSFSGIEKLDNNKAYLFISNHRDIVLDSAIMQALLVENNHETSQITFGSNLMSDDFIVNLGKLNKMFTFYRGGSKLRMYKNALLNSEYIRHVLTKEKESIWIAQRDGRTKDGDDKTQAALIKVLIMKRKNFLTALKELNIVPVTISYEYEPCDAEKVQELYISKSSVYKKQTGEDLDSILKGIKDYKGHINMTFGTPINYFLDELTDVNISINKLTEMIIHEIDNQTYKNYAIWPGNYIAYDLYKKTNKYSKNKYNQEQKAKFIDYVNTKVSALQGDKKVLANMFIRMYAMPVINKNKANEFVSGNNLYKNLVCYNAQITKNDSHINKDSVIRKDDKVDVLPSGIQLDKPKIFLIYRINKGVYNPDKGIYSDGNLKVEHEHLVPVFSIFVSHGNGYLAPNKYRL